jgi:uncharacterized protein YndB with AHSA1/START domain
MNTMMKAKVPVDVTTPSDREVVVKRVFNAPRALVFDAFVKPELLKRWLLGPDGWSLPVCNIDFRVGGKFRYVWREDATGTEMGLSGAYREIKRPEKTVHTELFDDFSPEGEAVVTTLFIEKDGKTMVEMTMLFPSKTARDGAVEVGMTDGMAVSYDRLDDVLKGM